MTSGQTKEQRRTSVVGPEHMTPQMSLFDYLASCRPPIDQKVIDIALSQCQVPRDLHDDAAQEIRLIWSGLTPNTQKYRPAQIAAYAHKAARDTCFRVRRELGSACRLPGSAFRKRKDGSSYITPGILSVPLNWSDLEGWFDTSDATDAPDVRPSAQLPLAPDLEDILDLGVEAEDEEDQDDERRRKRLATLESKAKLLSRPQYIVLARLIAGETFDVIEQKTGYKKGVVLREVAIGASLIGPECMLGLSAA